MLSLARMLRSMPITCSRSEWGVTFWLARAWDCSFSRQHPLAEPRQSNMRTEHSQFRTKIEHWRSNVTNITKPIERPVGSIRLCVRLDGWLQPAKQSPITPSTADTGITVDSSTESDGKVTVWLSGGTAGINYKVACLVETSAGRTDERTLWIRVVDR